MLKFKSATEEEDLQKLKYGDGTVYERRTKRKDGTERRIYQGRVYHEGKQISVYGRTKGECLDKMKELRKTLRTSEPTSPALRKVNVYKTYNAWLDEWITTFKSDLRPGYAKEFLRYVETVRQAFGHLAMSRITPLDVQRFIATLPKRNTTVKIYDVLNGSLQKAEDFGVLKRNPCRAIDRPTYKKSTRRAFELHEQVEIMSALAEPYRSTFFFLCCTGLRIGEFLALTEESIDKRLHVIKVRSSESASTGNVGDVKTANSVRNVVFLPTLPLDCIGKTTYKTIKTAFLPVFRELGLEDVSITHSCRHTYASMLHALGVRDKVIQMQCGHASITTTLDVYANVLMQGESPILDYFKSLKAELEARFL